MNKQKYTIAEKIDRKLLSTSVEANHKLSIKDESFLQEKLCINVL